MMSSNPVWCVLEFRCCCPVVACQTSWRSGCSRVMELPADRLRKARGFKVNLSAPLTRTNNIRLFPHLSPSHQSCSPLVRCSLVPRGVPSLPPQDSCVLLHNASNAKSVHLLIHDIGHPCRCPRCCWRYRSTSLPPPKAQPKSFRARSLRYQGCSRCRRRCQPHQHSEHCYWLRQG